MLDKACSLLKFAGICNCLDQQKKYPSSGRDAVMRCAHGSVLSALLVKAGRILARITDHPIDKKVLFPLIDQNIYNTIKTDTADF